MCHRPSTHSSRPSWLPDLPRCHTILSAVLSVRICRGERNMPVGLRAFLSVPRAHLCALLTSNTMAREDWFLFLCGDGMVIPVLHRSVPLRYEKILCVRFSRFVAPDRPLTTLHAYPTQACATPRSPTQQCTSIIPLSICTLGARTAVEL